MQTILFSSRLLYQPENNELKEALSRRLREKLHQQDDTLYLVNPNVDLTTFLKSYTQALFIAYKSIQQKATKREAKEEASFSSVSPLQLLSTPIRPSNKRRNSTISTSSTRTSAALLGYVSAIQLSPHSNKITFKDYSLRFVFVYPL